MAFIIVILSFWYTNNLVKKTFINEKQKVELWAKAVQKKASLVKFTKELFEKIKVSETKKAQLFAEATIELSKGNDLNTMQDLSFVLKVLQENTTIPVILTDGKDQIISKRNLDTTRENDPIYLQQELKTMKSLYDPVELLIYKGVKQKLYHKDSHIFNEIKLVFDSLIKSFINEIASNSIDVPVIFTNKAQTEIIAFGKIDSSDVNSSQKLKIKLQQLAKINTPIEIDLGEKTSNFIFYAHSDLLSRLTYYPYIQFGVIGLFLLITYIYFNTARKAEQDQVWIGMSKETAHQLGTPLSSLMAWNDHLLSIGVDPLIIHEMKQDVKRLNTITDRFSKIGSQPKLHSENINEVLENAIEYLKKRTSRNVIYNISLPEEILYANISKALFEWVIDNLCKNAVDAMDGKGIISISLFKISNNFVIDIKDTGNGISKAKFKTIFEPGFTTKKRGWGLGLSLCKRIINSYHKGKIFVLSSEINSGSTFRIEMKRS